MGFSKNFDVFIFMDCLHNKIKYLLIFLVNMEEILRSIYFWFTLNLSIFILVDLAFYCTGSSIFTLNSPIIFSFDFSSVDLLVDIGYSILYLLVMKITSILLEEVVSVIICVANFGILVVWSILTSKILCLLQFEGCKANKLYLTGKYEDNLVRFGLFRVYGVSLEGVIDEGETKTHLLLSEKETTEQEEPCQSQKEVRLAEMSDFCFPHQDSARDHGEC